MPHVGIDLEQFATDPYRSGIQRVLQQLALHWPSEAIEASFVVPKDNQYLLLSPQQAADLVGLGFSRLSGESLHEAVTAKIHTLAHSAQCVSQGTLIALFSTWLIPEVSYLPVVHERFHAFNETMPTAMIGYDALPMTEPANYRFRPGQAMNVSEYFRSLANADAVVCISDSSRSEILARLRRDPRKVSTVAHPGGDHIPVSHKRPKPDDPDSGALRLLRLGTLEARKRPLDALTVYEVMRAAGTDVELIFVGAPSASDESINARIRAAVTNEGGVQWLENADDDEVYRQMESADVFLSLGTEGYGIPVLESLRFGTPVFFEGVQPAAELMLSRGAFQLSSIHAEDIAAEVLTLSRNMRTINAQVDPDAVPQWSTFAKAVADVCA